MLTAHRSDIDGLRAVAVLPILLFHAGIAALPGGFLGVDIFFVISGFLITGILTREIADGRFSLLAFYRKRIVRIFPALFAMLAATMVAACLLQLPSELRDTGRSAAAAAAFVSNVHFARTADYFSGNAELMPLLHTWSLGVEEQFYLAYPVALIVVHRLFPRHVPAFLGLVVAGSLACAFVLEAWRAEAGFYLLPARGWQFAAGGLVAVLQPTARRDGLALLGLALIAASLAMAPSSLGVAGTIPVTVGAALLIAFGRNAATHHLLALGWMRWIGAISYSLYLWHWPIITFYRLETGLELSWVESALLIAASFAVAALSHSLIEQPMLRRYRSGRSAPVIAAGGAVLASAVAAALLVSSRPDGWRPISPEVRRIASYIDYVATPRGQAQFREGVCFASSKRSGYDYARCARPQPGRPNVLLLGDSHAAQYAQTLRQRLSGVHLMQITASGCKITPGAQGKERCVKLARYAYSGELARSAAISHVVLAGRWEAADAEEVARSVRHFRDRGIAATVIGPVHEFQGEFPLLLARAFEMRTLESMERFRLARVRAADRAIAAAAVGAGANYYSVLDKECPDRCRYLADDNAPVHFDYGHLTQGGAELLLADFPALGAAKTQTIASYLK